MRRLRLEPEMRCAVRATSFTGVSARPARSQPEHAAAQDAQRDDADVDPRVLPQDAGVGGRATGPARRSTGSGAPRRTPRRRGSGTASPLRSSRVMRQEGWPDCDRPRRICSGVSSAQAPRGRPWTTRIGLALRVGQHVDAPQLADDVGSRPGRRGRRASAAPLVLLDAQVALHGRPFLARARRATAASRVDSRRLRNSAATAIRIRVKNSA